MKKNNEQSIDDKLSDHVNLIKAKSNNTRNLLYGAAMMTPMLLLLKSAYADDMFTIDSFFKIAAWTYTGIGAYLGIKGVITDFIIDMKLTKYK